MIATLSTLADCLISLTVLGLLVGGISLLLEPLIPTSLWDWIEGDE